jgi:EmrB/QacA subfamily drug resistance transporter
VGGAIMFATSLALIAQAFQGKDRGTAFGIFGAVTGGAVAVGPLVGGAITSGIGWRWIFFVNVPIGVVAIVITMTRMQESRDPNKKRVDWIGFITFSASLFMLVYALVRGNTAGWGSSEIVGLLVGAGILMVAFIVAELRLREPMLDLSLFRRPAMIGISGAAFTLSASIFALFLYLTLFIQDDLGYGPLAAGVRFLPLTLLAFIVAPVAGKLTVRFPARYMLGVGLALVAGGCLWMATIQPASAWTVLLPGFILAGAGIGMVNPVLASSAVAVVPPERSGMASGINSTFRQVGIATGIAGLGAIFQSDIKSKVTASLLSSPAGQQVAAQHGAQLGPALAAGQVQQAAARLPHAQGQALTAAYHVGFASSLNLLMVIGAIIAFVGALGSFFLIRQRDFISGHQPVKEGEAPTPEPAPAVA